MHGKVVPYTLAEILKEEDKDEDEKAKKKKKKKRKKNNDDETKATDKLLKKLSMNFSNN